MNSHKILVADDSQTIQKVVSITLASEPYEIHECLSASKLILSIKKANPEVVLLDFNLSEDKTGYDLCKAIIDVSPQTKVVYLFGTFDTVDEEMISSSGASSWIVKPFDGNKFINLCRMLTSTDEQNESDSDEEETQDEWAMEGAQSFEKFSEIKLEEKVVEKTQSAITDAVADWGFEVPSVIGEKTKSEDFQLPPIIEAESSKTQVLEQDFPSDEDLEYPDEITNPMSLSDESIQESLEDQIAEEIDEDNLWKPDVGKERSIENVISLNQTPSDFPKDVMESEGESVSQTKQGFDEKVLFEHMKPFIEKIVREECQKSIEKIAWEVIPDLAENMISKALMEIKQETLSE